MKRRKSSQQIVGFCNNGFCKIPVNVDGRVVRKLATQTFDQDQRKLMLPYDEAPGFSSKKIGKNGFVDVFEFSEKYYEFFRDSDNKQNKTIALVSGLSTLHTTLQKTVRSFGNSLDIVLNPKLSFKKLFLDRMSHSSLSVVHANLSSTDVLSLSEDNLLSIVVKVINGKISCFGHSFCSVRSNEVLCIAGRQLSDHTKISDITHFMGNKVKPTIFFPQWNLISEKKSADTDSVNLLVFSI